MKPRFAITAGGGFALIVYLLIFGSAVHAQADKTNILVIMADDVGWSSLGSYHQGVKSIRTPNLDRLASEGMRFTDYYAQPSCTAGRSAFLTGQFPVRTGLHTVGLPGDPIGLNSKDPTIAQMLKPLGYATGQFGKNHLGDLNEFLPTAHGFDEFWGWLYHLNAMEYMDDPDWPNSEDFNEQFAPRNLVHTFATDTEDTTVHPRWGRIGKQRIEDAGPAGPERQKTLDDDVTRYTLDFIEKAHDAKKPFFVWMAPARAHIFTHLKPEYEELLGDGRGLQDVVMKELDDNVGIVLRKLDELGIADNTIVIFTSDNGPETMTWPDGGTTPFHGEKGTTWEGGFRVPAIIRWPGKVKPNTVVNDIFDSMDWMPTLVAAAGGPGDLPTRLRNGGHLGYEVHLDGYNQLDLLLGNGPSKREEIVYYEGATFQAIRYRDWKAHFIVQNEGWFGPKAKLGAPLLFNLRRDPYEKAAEESMFYGNWMAHKMWAFGPARRLVQQHLATMEDYPPRRPSATSNQKEMTEEMAEDQGFAQ